MFIYSTIHRSLSESEICQFEHVPFEVNGINIYASLVSSCISHWHAAAEFIAVVSGSFRFVVAGVDFKVVSGGVVFVSPNEIHGLVSLEEGSKILTVQVSPGLLQELAIPPGFGYRNLNPAIQEHQSLYKNILDLASCRVVDGGARRLLEMSLLYRAFDLVLQIGAVDLSSAEIEVRQHEQIVRACIEYVEENFSSQVSMMAMAKHHRISYYSLSKAFNRICGHGFKEFLALVRVERAKILLRQLALPITEVSLSCGFSEHKYLILAFKKHVGMTPTEYRKSVASMLVGQSAQPKREVLQGVVRLDKEVLEAWEM